MNFLGMILSWGVCAAEGVCLVLKSLSGKGMGIKIDKKQTVSCRSLEDTVLFSCFLPSPIDKNACNNDNC